MSLETNFEKQLKPITEDTFPGMRNQVYNFYHEK